VIPFLVRVSVSSKLPSLIEFRSRSLRVGSLPTIRIGGDDDGQVYSQLPLSIVIQYTRSLV
jgi:hypothetical protein